MKKAENYSDLEKENNIRYMIKGMDLSSNQGKVDFSLGWRIFKGIVQQDGHQLPQGTLITVKGDHGLNLGRKLLVLGHSQGLEGLGRLGDQVGKGEFDHLQPVLLLHSG